MVLFIEMYDEIFLLRIVQVLKLLFICLSFTYFSLHLCIKMFVTPSSLILLSYTKRRLHQYVILLQIVSHDFKNGVPVSEENLSARPICQGGHIFLGNSVLLDRIYCPPLG